MSHSAVERLGLAAVSFSGEVDDDHAGDDAGDGDEEGCHFRRSFPIQLATAAVRASWSSLLRGRPSRSKALVSVVRSSF
jgi:hypothetical protein